MPEYIEREALIAEYDRVHEGPAGGARQLMIDAPAADVQEVKRGKWVTSPQCIKILMCSLCGAVGDGNIYCGHCGAKMDRTYVRQLQKRERILIEIKPICEVFGIADYDYVITESGKERLKLNDIYIGCDGNSVSAVVDELIGYIFIKHYCKNRSLGVFDKQTQNYIKRYWMKE